MLRVHNKLGEYIPISEVFLEVVADPESVDDEQLVVSLLPDMDAVETDEWWLDNMHQACGRLCITLEFR